MKFSIDLTYSDNIWTAAALGIVGQGITVNSAIGGWLDNLSRHGTVKYLEEKCTDPKQSRSA